MRLAFESRYFNGMVTNNTGIIIQARTSSTRFPKKIIREFDGNNTFLDVLLKRMQLISKEIPAVLATTTNKDDQILSSYASKYNISVFFGPEHNVLNRFIECADFFKFERIIRVCSDNPFLDINLISELLEKYNGEDYLSFMVNGKPSILTHSGFFSEMVSVQALKKLKNKGGTSCIEHVTNCIYTSPEEFNVKFIEKKVPYSIRCTLDTENDFENLKKIYFNWYKPKQKENFGLHDLVEFLQQGEAENLLESMKNEIKNNLK